MFGVLNYFNYQLLRSNLGGGGGGVHQNTKVCDRGCVIANVGTYFFLI